MTNKYQYNAVDNILGITNAVDPTRGNTNGDKKLGGAFKHSYAYDDLNRLVYASGKAKQASYSMQMTFGRISELLTKVQKVDSTKTAQSYDFTYKYEDSNHPTAPTQIGHDHYTYDANGNPTLVENDSLGTERRMYWDEDNRLMVLSDNGKTSRYTYNAAGERIMKSYGTMEGVYINGAPQGITLTDVDFRLRQDKMSKLFCAWFALKFHETDNFTLYPASILSVNKNRFTKHYFIGDKRVASRIGTGLFNNVYGRNGSYVTAGQQDYAERMNQIQTQKEAYYKKVGVAPGVPTEKGAYGDPENTGVGYNAVLTELGNHDVPQGWIQTPRPNTTHQAPTPVLLSHGTTRVTLMTRRLDMVIFQMTQHVRKPSSITVITSAQRLTSQTIKPISLSMMLICHTVNCWLMSIVAARTCPTSSMARNWMKKLDCITMVPDTWIPKSPCG